MAKMVQTWQDDSMLCMADVVPEEVPWLWKNRLPRGEITVIDGDPGQGKSMLTIEIASHLSTGKPWPDGAPCDCGPVLILSAEDDPRRTIRPRLDAAGAAPGLVYAFQDEVTLDANDLVKVRELAKRFFVVAVIIDPLMAYLATGANSWKDQDMRKQLQPLQQMARELDLAVIIVRHLNKGSGGKAIYRGQGSIGTIAAARMGWVVETDPDNPDLRVLACTKSNLGPMPPSLSYRLEQTTVEGLEEPVGRVVWLGESAHTAEALLASSGEVKEQNAEGFLREQLADGPMASTEVMAMAKEARIPRNAVWKAKDALKVRAFRKGFGGEGQWCWELPFSQEATA
jgi:hypothetical protein